MKCIKCGKEIEEDLELCEYCSNKIKEEEDLDEILKDILEEDDEVLFPITNKDKEPIKKRKISIKQIYKKNEKENTNNKVKKNIHPDYIELVINISKYIIMGSIILFVISMFISWFSFSGDGMNIGFIRNENSKKFMPEIIRERTVESLSTYEGILVTFTGNDLYQFGKNMDEEYLTLHGIDGEIRTSLVAKIHQYYLKSVIFLFLLSAIAFAILLGFKGYKGINIVRNIGILNLVIIGLNYLAMKLAFFNIFVIKAKDILGQSEGYVKVVIKNIGILYNDHIYSYTVKEEFGFYLAIITLSIWLATSIVLSEIKNRDEEIAIENGEMD